MIVTIATGAGARVVLAPVQVLVVSDSEKGVLSTQVPWYNRLGLWFQPHFCLYSKLVASTSFYFFNDPVNYSFSLENNF